MPSVKNWEALNDDNYDELMASIRPVRQKDLDSERERKRQTKTFHRKDKYYVEPEPDSE